MDKYQIKYSTQAANDIRGIYAYICYNLSSPISAKNQINRIRNRIRELDTFPNRYPIVDLEPWHKMGMRKLSVEKYVIIYFADDNSLTIDISRILYSGRNIKSIAEEI